MEEATRLLREADETVLEYVGGARETFGEEEELWEVVGPMLTGGQELSEEAESILKAWAWAGFPSLSRPDDADSGGEEGDPGGECADAGTGGPATGQLSKSAAEFVPAGMGSADAEPFVPLAAGAHAEAFAYPNTFYAGDPAMQLPGPPGLHGAPPAAAPAHSLAAVHAAPPLDAAAGAT